MRDAAVREDDGGGGAVDRGQKKWPSVGGGGSLFLYIHHPLVAGRVTNHDKRGPFVTVTNTTRD
jgi:hypothetical protein